VKEARQWWSESDGARGTWLILGKGRSLERVNEFDLSSFRTLSLNHVVREISVEAASIIDIEVVADCGEVLDRNARFLLMPRYPHVKTSATDRPLEGFFSEFPVLEKLSKEGRLVWYNFATGKPQPPSPQIPEGYFSGEVMVSLLAILGARSIRTLGMDGSTSYSSHFKDIEERTKLANRHNSFDLQWQGIATMVRTHGIDYAPLTTEVPIRVFVGCDDSQRIAAKVLEYSIRKHCPVSLVFDMMDDVEVPLLRHPKNQPQTDFSFKRFEIPKRVGFSGRAVYLDADMLVLANFLKLWDIPCNGAKVLYAPSPNPRWPTQMSVLKLNCDELTWDLSAILRGLDENAYDYEGLMKELCIEPADQVRPAIPPEWNSLELYEPGKTGLLHYTRMMKQPWVSCKNANGNLWVQYLKEAIAAEFVSFEEVKNAVKRGFARPSLPVQLKLPQRLWPFFTTCIGPVIDARFRPHRKLVERLTASAQRG
jgi:hypothetical protein